MNIKYNPDNGILYLELVEEKSGTQKKTSNKDVFEFRADDGELISYRIENPAKNMRYIIKHCGLTPVEQLAVAVRLVRGFRDYEDFRLSYDILPVICEKVEKGEVVDDPVSMDILHQIVKTTLKAKIKRE